MPKLLQCAPAAAAGRVVSWPGRDLRRANAVSTKENDRTSLTVIVLAYAETEFEPDLPVLAGACEIIDTTPDGEIPVRFVLRAP
ncbi:MAG: hypothetical protein HC923_01670 [Myxococcales bacterium]|nr:hypothetical protein [Myxococcales bacterium]